MPALDSDLPRKLLRNSDGFTIALVTGFRWSRVFWIARGGARLGEANAQNMGTAAVCASYDLYTPATARGGAQHGHRSMRPGEDRVLRRVVRVSMKLRKAREPVAPQGVAHRRPRRPRRRRAA